MEPARTISISNNHKSLIPCCQFISHHLQCAVFSNLQNSHGTLYGWAVILLCTVFTNPQSSHCTLYWHILPSEQSLHATLYIRAAMALCMLISKLQSSHGTHFLCSFLTIRTVITLWINIFLNLQIIMVLCMIIKDIELSWHIVWSSLTFRTAMAHFMAFFNIQNSHGTFHGLL